LEVPRGLGTALVLAAAEDLARDRVVEDTLALANGCIAAAALRGKPGDGEIWVVEIAAIASPCGVVGGGKARENTFPTMHDGFLSQRTLGQKSCVRADPNDT